MEKIAFSEETLLEVKQIIAKYPEGRQKSALIPVLHLAQREFGGWLNVSVMDYVADLLSLKPIEVYEVATFYTMFNMKPVGKYVLEICITGPCLLKGSDRILNYVKEKLGIEEGETTEDGLFTIKSAQCLGACGYAPMMQLGDKYHEYLTKEKIDEILQLCREGQMALQ